MALEGLLLDDIDLNGSSWRLESFEVPPPTKRAEWAQGGDVDGAALVRDPLFENRSIGLRLRVVQQSDMDAALAAVAALSKKIEECEQQAEGLPLVWTPADASSSLTFYVLTGQVTDLPMTQSGDDVGWFQRSPVVNVQLTCKPFGYGAEITGSSTSSSGQLVSLTLASVPGDVPAEGRLIVTDTASQNRRYVEWGLEQRHYNSSSLQITPTVTGFVGSSATRSGSVNTNIARGTLAATPLTIAGLGAQGHIGTYRVKVRVYPSALDIYVRIAYSDGAGQLRRNTYQAPPVQNWVELDLGVITINEAQLGTQTWTGQIEAYSTTNGTTLDVDYIILVPAGEGYGRARSPELFETPTNASAHDEFDQSAGTLSGKTLPLGGTWSGAGDTDDFSVNATTHKLERTAVSDADLQTGRYAIAGTTSYTNIAVQTDLTRGTASGSSSGLVYQGVFARYTDANNWVMAVMSTAYAAGPSAYSVRLIKRVSGTATTIATSTGTLYTGVRLVVDTNGRYQVWTNPTQPGSVLLLQGSDTSLATGGALASGKVGIYDADTTALALTRIYDNFFAFVPAGNNALYSGRAMEFRYDGAIRQDSTGTYYSPAPTYRGSRFLIPPAGDAGRTSRVVVKAHRNNIEVNDAVNVTDGLSASVTYTPRYLVVPG